MRKFIRDQEIRDLPFPSLFQEHFRQVFQQMNNRSSDPLLDINSAVAVLTLSESVVTKSDQWFDNELFSCISPYKMDYLEDNELDYLMHSYSTFLEGVDVVNESAIFDRFASVEFCGGRYGSLDLRSERSSYVIASWVGDDGQIDLTSSETRPGVVHYY